MAKNIKDSINRKLIKELRKEVEHVIIDQSISETVDRLEIPNYEGLESFTQDDKKFMLKLFLQKVLEMSKTENKTDETE